MPSTDGEPLLVLRDLRKTYNLGLPSETEVLHASGQMREHDEASPNLPGVSAVISRPRAVTVQFLNAQGALEERDFVELWATSVQHQIDHLAGKMYFDHLSPLKRKMLKGKLDDISKGKGSVDYKMVFPK